MTMKRLVVLLGMILVSNPPLAAQSATITWPWIYGPEAQQLDQTPQHQWLDDGSLLLYDESLEGLRAGARRLDPATGKVTPHFDFVAAIRAIAKLDGKAASSAGFPDSIDAKGRMGLWLLDDDVFVYDREQERAIRITRTPAEEKAVRFSPDGRRLAYVRENDLWVYDIDAGIERRLTEDGSETILNGTLSWVYWEEIFGRQDLGYWWSEDSSTLAFLRTDEGQVGKAYFLDHRENYPKLIEQRYPKAGTANPVVKVGICRLGADPTPPIYVDFGEARWEYVARVKWLPDSSEVAISTLNRAQNRLDLWLAGRAEGKARHVLTEEDPGWVNINDDLHFLKDGKRFLWTSERSGYAHLWAYGIDGKPIGAVTKGDFAIRDSGAVFWLRQALKAVDEEAGYAYVGSLEKSSIENHLYRAKLDGSSFERLSKEDGTHVVSFSKDAKYYVDVFSDARTPPSMVLHRADGSVFSVLSKPRTEAAAALDMVYPEFLSVPARDGFEMPAWIMKPKNFDSNRKYPVIVYGYGGPSAPSVSNSWQGNDLLTNQVFVRDGFIVACIDNRSATARSKKLENTILGQMYGDSELNDLVDGVRWLKKQPFVDAERVGLWGWSGGGSLTLLGLTNSEEFKAGIAVAAVTRWNAYDTVWGEASMKTPRENPEGYARTDLVDRAKDLHGRLLLVHGTYDDNVHPQNCWRFVDALIEAQKTFELMIYPMRKHGITDRSARIHLFTTMEDFWKRNL